MADVLQKVKKLIALAGSPNLDEARNAAFLAVKLIRENNLLVYEPAPAGGTAFPAPSVRVRVTVRSRGDDANWKSNWKKMKAKFKGQCVFCRKTIQTNAVIYWSPDHEGAYHANCFNKAHGQ